MKAWAITNAKGRIIIYTVKLTAREARRTMVDRFNVSWSDLSKEGFRCVPVNVLPIEK